jgi:hypothetical protein
VADFIREGINGSLIDWTENARKLAKTSFEAIQRVVGFGAMDCLSSVQSLSLGADYRRAHGGVLDAITHTTLQHDQARVTVGLRIHKGMRIDHLDQAAGSLAQQTYKRFRTILLVDGPWEYAEKIAARYDLPLICTGLEPDITHCSGLHRKAVEQCNTEFYKPLDYDDQLLPGYLERAVNTLDRSSADVYGCLLTTLEGDQLSPRWWPNKPVEAMFTGNPNDNQLPHSSVLMRAAACRAAGNYNAVAVGLGADDYSLWHRLHKSGAKILRDDEVRNVVYRIHEKNSLKIRKARYGNQNPNSGSAGKLIAGAAAASMALWVGADVHGAPAASSQQHVVPSVEKKVSTDLKRQDEPEKQANKVAPAKGKKTPIDLIPPQS